MKFVRRHLLTAYAIAAFAYLLVPIAIVIAFSFNDPAGRYNYTWQGFTLRQWQNWDGVPGLKDAMVLSLEIALLAAIVATALGTLIALALVRYGFRGRGGTNVLIFVPMATPEVVLGASLLLLFLNLSSFVTLGFGTILIAHIMFCISYVVVTVKARLISFDRSLEEAAMDLGANEFTTFRKVTLPLIAPAILSGLLLSFALSVDDFVVTYFNSGSDGDVPALRLGRRAARGAAAGQRLRYRYLRRRPRPDADQRAGSAATGGSPCMSTDVHTQIDSERVKELIKREGDRLEGSTQESRRMFERAHKVMPLGVPSSYHAREPWPIYLDRGDGAVVWDVDGRQLWDFHNGFGSMVMGHAHPAVVEAISERARLGTHFAAPTEDGIVVAEELARRFGLPKWRFTNSGSEATMDAIRIARGLKGRDTIMKIFGSYHGHHDGVMVAVGVGVGIDWNEVDPDDIPSFPYGGGVPQAVADLTVAVPFNDADALERRLVRLEQEGRKPACLIMEAAMMNLGVVLPEPGYLEAVREITKQHDVVLIFDEVKTGLAIAAGGATERFGVQPDMVTLAKTLGAGLPSGAIGATDEVMEVVESETVFQVGTFNGNPLTMAAARAGLLEVLTPRHTSISTRSTTGSWPAARRSSTVTGCRRTRSGSARRAA